MPAMNACFQQADRMLNLMKGPAGGVDITSHNTICGQKAALLGTCKYLLMLFPFFNFSSSLVYVAGKGTGSLCFLLGKGNQGENCFNN